MATPSAGIGPAALRPAPSLRCQGAEHEARSGFVRRAHPPARGELALAARRALVRDARPRCGAEDECGVRTPFQRDRDRIVHSKPFRRLKQQDAGLHRPGGRPLPHADDAHARDDGDRARRRARAAAERGPDRGDRARARPRATRRSATPARRRSTRRCRSASARRFRHNEQSLRGSRERAQPDRTRSATASSRTPATPSRQTLEGKIVRIVDRVAYINHDIDDAVRFGILEPDDLPHDEIELLGPTGSRRIDTLVHDLVETSRARGRHRAERRDRRGDALAARVHVRAASTSARTRVREHERAHAAIRAIFDAPRRRAATASDEIVEFVAGMTDRFALAYAETPRRWRASRTRRFARSWRRRTWSRSSPARTALRRAGARFTGPLPVPRGADAELLRQPGGQALLLLRLRQGRRRDHVRARDREPRLRGGGRVRWPSASASRSSTRSRSPKIEADRKRRERLHAVLEQATSFFERVLWETKAGEPVRDYLESRGLGEEVCKEFRLGLSPGSGLAQKALEKGFTRDELQRRRPRERARQRLLPAAADVPARRRARAHRRLPGAQAARGRPAARQVRQLARGRALPQERDPLRAPPRAPGDREAGAGGRRRGEHRRDRAPPGGVRAGRRLDGDGAHRAAPEGAPAADAARLSLLRRRRGRGGGDAARDGARGRPGLRRARRDAAEGAGPRRRTAGIRGAARRRRELRRLPRPARARAGARPAGGVRARARGARSGSRTRPSARTRCGCSPTSSTCRRRRSPG